jgi:nucleotide-binding universal stress UspA family protein
MKTLIVPIDFSEESLNGLDLAVMLARKSNAKILLVHVIPRVISEDISITEKKIKNANLKFENLLQSCQERRDFRCNMNYLISRGRVFSDVTNVADKHEDPLIVLSTHGASGFEKLFIGGNAFKIASNAKNPVITVRQSNLTSNIDKIVMPLDNTLQTREKVPYTVNFAKLFNSEIHIVTIRTSNHRSIEKKLHKYSSQVAEFVQDHKIPFRLEHLQGVNLTDLTLDYSRSVKTDLISILAEQEKDTSNNLLGNNAHQMINKSQIPVLVIPSYAPGARFEETLSSGALAEQMI